MFIYRLESRQQGDGPFTKGPFFEYLNAFFTNKSHPAPESDGFDCIDYDGLVFGCPSFNMLKYWMVCTKEKRLAVLKHYESSETEESTLKIVRGTNNKMFHALGEYDFVVARYDMPDEHCTIGTTKTQVVFNRDKAYFKTQHHVKALFRGALM